MGSHIRPRAMTLALSLGVVVVFAAPIDAQNVMAGAAAVPAAATAATPSPGVVPPADYLIGPDDQLSVVFWRDKEVSGDVTVRPDGKISLPLVNDIQASGLTPEQLRVAVTEAASRFLEEPIVSVVVREINSRNVFITGNVAKQGLYRLAGPTTVMQLIAMAGGLLEYADEQNIKILRVEKGRPVNRRFNYKWVLEGKNPAQNIELKPGDTVVVP